MIPTLPPPGWYQDPDNTGALRWWSGQNWTEYTSVSQTSGPQPMGQPVVQQQNPSSAPTIQQHLSAPVHKDASRKKSGLLFGLGMGAVGVIIPIVVIIALVISVVSFFGSQMRNDPLPSQRNDYYGDTL